MQILLGVALGLWLTTIPGFDRRVIQAIQSVNLLGVLGILIVVHFTAVTIHECGHLLGGRLGGTRFRMILIGPLALIRLSAGLKLQWSPLLVTGGLAATYPTTTDGLRRKLSFMISGGPLASLTSAGIAYLMDIALGPHATPAIRWLLEAYTAYSLLLGVVNLFPFQMGMFRTDGARLLMLIRNTEVARRWCALAVVVGSSLAGTHPREWDAGLVQTLLAEREGNPEFLGAFTVLYQWYVDRGELDQAGVGSIKWSRRRKRFLLR